MMANVNLLRYLWEIFRKLPGSLRQRRKTVLAMSSSIRDYVSKGTKPDYDQFIERFGHPNQVAATFVNEMETDELLDRLHIHGMVFKTVLAAMVVVTAVWIGFLAAAYGDHEKDMDGYMVIETVEVQQRITLEEGEN